MEYEYSFKVKNLEPYINYCVNNKYNFIEKSKQTITIYRNVNKTMARITIKENNGKIEKLLDFKDDILSDEILIERKETLPLKFNDYKAIESILSFLKYHEDNTLIRTRLIYKKGNVKFELDDYEKPTKEFVVAIEGNKEEVDKVYLELV